MKKAILWLLAVSCISCGVKFKDAPVNLSMPDYFKTRNLYDRTDIWRFKLPELVGLVIADSGSGTYDRLRRIVKDGYEAKLEIIPDADKKVYSSRIDRGAAVEGSYLLFSAGLQANQMAELTIEDVSLAFINDADIPWERLRAEAVIQPPNSNARRFWIQGALLTTITINYYQEISANASGVVGETFGAKGKVYNKQGTTQRDFKISLELVDMDQLAASARDMPMKIFPSPQDIQKLKPMLLKSLAKNMIIKEIKE
jgi:hypothetical protein